MSIEPSAAHRLIESHRSYAHAIAGEILRKLPSHVDKADLQAAAELGLTEAASAFDGRPGVQFKTFAYYRIRGAVYDAIRKATWFPRADAAVNQYFTDASATAQDPIADLPELERHVSSVVTCYMLSLDTAEVEAPASRTKSAEERVIQQEWHTRLHAALARLPIKQRSLLKAYYFEDKSLEEIGAGLGLSKSWTCRLHAKAIELLRQELEVRTTLAAPAR
jgi:RNA polymerase sigma factor for flagellar operon FliA